MTWVDFVTNIPMQNAGIQHLCTSAVAEGIYFWDKAAITNIFW